MPNICLTIPDAILDAISITFDFAKNATFLTCNFELKSDFTLNSARLANVNHAVLVNGENTMRPIRGGEPYHQIAYEKFHVCPEALKEEQEHAHILIKGIMSPEKFNELLTKILPNAWRQNWHEISKTNPLLQLEYKINQADSNNPKLKTPFYSKEQRKNLEKLYQDFFEKNSDVSAYRTSDSSRDHLQLNNKFSQFSSTEFFYGTGTSFYRNMLNGVLSNQILTTNMKKQLYIAAIYHTTLAGIETVATGDFSTALTNAILNTGVESLTIALENYLCPGAMSKIATNLHPILFSMQSPSRLLGSLLGSAAGQCINYTLFSTKVAHPGSQPPTSNLALKLR